MQWLSPTSAWFGLSILLIIAMYILKKRYTPHIVSSTLLWKKILKEQEVNKPWQRLKQRLLLWLQIIIAIIIVLALMKPGLEMALTKENQMIIVLDTSYSMYALHNENGQSYFDQAKQELKQFLKSESNGNAITIIRNGDYPEIVISNETGLDVVMKSIDGIQPYFGVAQDEATTSLARSLATSDDNSMLYYFVDAKYKGMVANEQAGQLPFNEQWHVFGMDNSHNSIYVRNFAVQSSNHEAVEAYGTVAHANVKNTDISITVQAKTEKNELVGTVDKKVRLEEQDFTTFNVLGLPVADYYMVEIAQLAQDSNAIDHIQYAVLDKATSKSVLLLTEGNLFLEKSLQLMNIDVKKSKPSGQLPNIDENEVKFIIIDGGYEQYSTEWKSYLAKFPLFIIDHPDGTAEHTNFPTGQKTIVEEHEITSYLLFNDIYISQMKKLSQDEQAFGKSILSYGGFPAIIAGYQNQKPMIRFTFSLADSDLPLRAEFPILMMQAFDYMSSGSSESVGQYLIGDQLQLTLSPNTSSAYWKPVETMTSYESEERYKSDDYISLPNVPGVYSLIEEDNSSNIVQSRLAIVQGDMSEIAWSNEQGDQMNEMPLDDNDNRTGENGWKSLIPFFAMFIFLGVVIEWEVYRRGL